MSPPTVRRHSRLGLSDGKGSRYTNNVPTSPSVDDGSASVKTKTENDRAALGRGSHRN